MSKENIDVQEFELEDKEVEDVVVEVDPLDELVSLDFTEDFDVEKYHQEIQKLKGGASAQAEELKVLEAENIIKDLGPKYLNDDYYEEMSKTAQSLSNYIKKFNADGEEMKTIDASEDPEKGKDQVYELANFLFNNFITKINTLEFSMELTVGEHKFLDTTLRQKTEYDGNEVLNIVTLLPKLEEWRSIQKALPRGAEGFMIDVSIQDVVMVYHFISAYKVKGIGTELENFYNLLTKIGETNKIFNAYNIIKDRLGEDFKQWTSSITIETPDEEMPTNEEIPVVDANPGEAEGMVYKNGEWVKA